MWLLSFLTYELEQSIHDRVDLGRDFIDKKKVARVI